VRYIVRKELERCGLIPHTSSLFSSKGSEVCDAHEKEVN
jgi:hypothetical protein